MVSIVTPAFNEARNLPILYERLSWALQREAIDWEWIIIDDHSSDDTPLAIETLIARDSRVRAVRTARTVGSNAAILCGFDEVEGRCVTLMAADLLDPPDLIPDLLRRWKDGAHIVWAVPSRSPSTGGADWFSRAYRRLMRFIGLSAAASEAAFFLADRRVTAAIRQFRDSNVSVFVRLGWMGFRQEAVEYGPQTKDRNPAALPWLERVDALANAVTPFSDLPLRAGIAAGLLVLAVGLMCAAAAFLGISVGPLSPGWILLLSGILVVGGLNLLLLGVIGAYVWRAIDGLSARPRHLVERRFGAQRKSTRELSL